MSLQRRCALLGVSRTLHYYAPRFNAYNEQLCRIIDEQYLKTPCYGVERMTAHLQRTGHAVNEKRIRRLMRLMGLIAIYPKKRSSQGNVSHKKYPYLLRGLTIERPNEVWCADITYIPMQRGFMYLIAIMDWYSRKVLSWAVSNTLDDEFCVDALKEALSNGRPEIFNTDQGSQFTGAAFIETLLTAGVRISMDGKGRWVDNVMVERLWRTVKYEYIYLNAFRDGKELRQGLAQWFEYYNKGRVHSSLDWATPDEVYNGCPVRMKIA
jgi:putative transposase